MVTNKDWYQGIEEPVREVVKLMRDNGFNTTCSCGHEMVVQADLIPGGELYRLYKLLYDHLADEKRPISFTIDIHLEVTDGHPRCFLEVKLSNNESRE